jgi:hypothetical protein
MDFKVGDRVPVCFPEDMRPVRWDSVQALVDGRTGTIAQCVSGFWGVKFAIVIVPGSHAEQGLRPGSRGGALPAAWLRKMTDVGGLLLGPYEPTYDRPSEQTNRWTAVDTQDRLRGS